MTRHNGLEVLTTALITVGGFGFFGALGGKLMQSMEKQTAQTLEACAGNVGNQALSAACVKLYYEDGLIKSQENFTPEQMPTPAAVNKRLEQHREDGKVYYHGGITAGLVVGGGITLVGGAISSARALRRRRRESEEADSQAESPDLESQVV